MEYASGNVEYVNTVNHYLGMVLATHSVDEVTEASFGEDIKAEINGFFYTLMTTADHGQVHSESGTPFCFDIFKIVFKQYVQSAFTKELENQLQGLRNETTTNIGAGRV